MSTFQRRARNTLCALAIATVAGVSSPAMADDDFTAMLNQAIAAQNAAVQSLQSIVSQIVEAHMKNPAVLRAYRIHRQQSVQHGKRPLDLRTFAYHYAATAGFSPAGMQIYRDVNERIEAQERAALLGRSLVDGAARPPAP